jgi:Ca2+/Na+ antiporter
MPGPGTPAWDLALTGVTRVPLHVRYVAAAEGFTDQRAADVPGPALLARKGDACVAALALIVVLAASTVMERIAATLGTRFAIPEIITGGLVLAAVTSLPNAVAAVFLARRGQAAATLSEALNSNTLNVLAGLLYAYAVFVVTVVVTALR